MNEFAPDYCPCGKILMLHEIEYCDWCYQKPERNQHDEDLKDLATIVGGADRRKDGSKE